MTAGLRYGGSPRLTIKERLAAAQQGQANYTPHDEVSGDLSEKTLGSLIGPSGSGKSHLIPFVIKLGGDDFSEVGNMSSRLKRENDPANFRGSQSLVELLGRIRRRELVNYMVHPSGNIYATDTQSYTTRYVLLPTLTTAVAQLQQSGFKEVKPVGIVAAGAEWEKRLGENKDNLSRMMEAMTCAQWLQARIGKMPILENKTGEEEITAQQIVDIMRDPNGSFSFDTLERLAFILDEMATIATRHVRRLT